MSKDTTYPYEQTPIKLSANFDSIMDEWKKLNLPSKHLLELYIRVRSERKGSELQTEPFPTNNNQNISLNFQEYHDILSGIMKKLSAYAPIRFMRQFEAVFYPKENLSGIENGLAYTEFIEQGEKASHLVMIDPNPYLVEQLSMIKEVDDINRFRDRLVLCFTDPLYAEIYQKARELKKYSVKAFDEVEFSSADNVRCLYFCRMHREKGDKKDLLEVLSSRINHIRDKIVFAPKHKLYLLLPTAMLDRDAACEGLRPEIMKSFLLEKIFLIDSKAAVSDTYKKISFVTLGIQQKKSTPEKIQKRKVTLQRFILPDANMVEDASSGDRDNEVAVEQGQTDKLVADVRELRGQKEYKILASVLFSNRATLHELYAAAPSANRHHKKRNSSELYKISAEIEFRYSGKVNLDGSIKPRIIFQGSVARKKGINYKEEKKKLHFEERTRKYPSIDAMYENIERISFEDNELRSMIEESVVNAHGKNPLSLKSFLMLHYLVFMSKKPNEDLFNKVFCAPHSYRFPICKLVIATATQEDIMNAVDQTTVLLQLSEAEVDALWHQIHILLAIAEGRGLIPENPILSIIKKLDNQQKQETFFKKNMTEKILSDEMEFLLLNDILKNKDEPGLALGVVIKIFTGLSYAEVCALVWQDYFKLLDHECMVLNIEKRFEDKKTVPIWYLSELKIRTIPIVSYLEPLVTAWREKCREEYKKFNINKSEERFLPMIHSMKNPMIPVTPDALRRFGNKYLQKYLPDGLALRLADKDGRKKEYNTGEYGGDFLRENFRDQALSVAGLEGSEVCYMLGISASGTFQVNYTGHDKPIHLLRIRDKLDVWFSKRMPELCNVDGVRKKITLSSERGGYESILSNQPMELVFRVPITEQTPDIAFDIFNRLGFSATFEWIEDC